MTSSSSPPASRRGAAPARVALADPWAFPSPSRHPAKAYAERLGATEGATSARITGAEGTTARVSIAFDGKAISTEARDLVNRLKDVPEPSGARAYFGGESAVYDDTLDALGETLQAGE
ncbi:MMPL family transporter [Streptomyces spinoverrucosus]|uniref:MMPL family transporter n=1 Tax=Streptomyces spinoverrucosus TaxID=284043 RepID=UPI0018C3C21E|nr:MMPL family transporter [Streptomyces spinoverrucosus]MBG0851361.1 MMPL family transporter [Streptomyces spinoverrucosus]